MKEGRGETQGEAPFPRLPSPLSLLPLFFPAEVTGAWWCPWSSKPVWGSQGSRVGSIPIRLRHFFLWLVAPCRKMLRGIVFGVFGRTAANSL